MGHVAWEAAVVVAVLAALFLALPGGAGARWPLVALVVVAVSDIGFVTYLNSGYTDQAGFIGGAEIDRFANINTSVKALTRRAIRMSPSGPW